MGLLFLIVGSWETEVEGNSAAHFLGNGWPGFLFLNPGVTIGIALSIVAFITGPRDMKTFARPLVVSIATFYCIHILLLVVDFIVGPPDLLVFVAMLFLVFVPAPALYYSITKFTPRRFSTNGLMLSFFVGPVSIGLVLLLLNLDIVTDFEAEVVWSISIWHILFGTILAVWAKTAEAEA